MINFDRIRNKKTKEHIPNWSHVLHYSYEILIIGFSITNFFFFIRISKPSF